MNFNGYLSIKELLVIFELLNICFFMLILWLITARNRSTGISIHNTPEAKSYAINGDKNKVDVTGDELE